MFAIPCIPVRPLALLLFGCAPWTSACGGSVGAPPADAGLAPACRFAPGLASSDAGSSREACIGARALLSCQEPSGFGTGCLSDDRNLCAGLAGSSCQNECAESEYVVQCGGVGPGNVPDPPSECKFASAIPAGIAYYCCPCVP